MLWLMASWRAKWCDPAMPGPELDPVHHRARRNGRPTPIDRLRAALDRVWPDVAEVIEARRLIEAHGIDGYAALRGAPTELLIEAIGVMETVEARLDYVARLRMARIERGERKKGKR